MMMGSETAHILSHLWMSTLVLGVVIYLVFDYVTVRRLEGYFHQHSTPQVVPDGLGLYTVYYAIALAFHTVRLSRHDYPFIPVNETRRLATATDKFLATLFTANFALCMGLLVVIAIGG